MVEFGVPVWHPGLTYKDSNDIERIQKLSFKIILEGCYTDYTEASLLFDTTTRKNLKNNLSFFHQVQKTVDTRSEKPVFKEFKCRTSRYFNSSLPYQVRLLNLKH